MSGSCGGYTALTPAGHSVMQHTSVLPRLYTTALESPKMLDTGTVLRFSAFVEIITEDINCESYEPSK